MKKRDKSRSGSLQKIISRLAIPLAIVWLVRRGCGISGSWEVNCWQREVKFVT